MTLLDVRRRWPGRTRLNLLLGWLAPRFIVLCWFRLFYRVRLIHQERIPRDGPFVVVANHVSHLDPMLTGLASRDRPLTSLARDTLFRFKPFGAILRWVGAVPLAREKGGTAALRVALRELDEGRTVVMFPEGTRSPDGRLGEFRGGFLLLVRRSKAPVLPMWIDGAFDVWPRTRRYPRLFGRVSVTVREPIPAERFDGLNEEQCVEIVRAALEGR